MTIAFRREHFFFVFHVTYQMDLKKELEAAIKEKHALLKQKAIVEKTRPNRNNCDLQYRKIIDFNKIKDKLDKAFDRKLLVLEMDIRTLIN